MKPLTYKISKGDGALGLMCPPGHWNLEYALVGHRGSEMAYHGSIDAAEEMTDVPESIRSRARAIKAKAQFIESELWIRNVYGYFKTMYVPESGWKAASDLVQDPSRGPENHAAVACIRRYFPDHEPRLDLIENPGRGYGSYPCDKCGERVQYEPREDAWVVYATKNAECTVGGVHEVALYPADEE